MLKLTNEDVPTSFQLIRKMEFIYIYMWTLLELGMFCFFNKMMGFSTTRPDGHINMDASGIYLIQNDCGIESLY
jgi:hypothetical protein